MVTGASMSYYENLRSKCPSTRQHFNVVQLKFSLGFCFLRYIFLFPLHRDIIHAKYKNFYKFVFLQEFNKRYECPIRDMSHTRHKIYLYDFLIVFVTIFNIYDKQLLFCLFPQFLMWICIFFLLFYLIFIVFWSFFTQIGSYKGGYWHPLLT